MVLNVKLKRLCFNLVDNREWVEVDDQISMMIYGNVGGYFGNGGGGFIGVREDRFCYKVGGVIVMRFLIRIVVMGMEKRVQN